MSEDARNSINLWAGALALSAAVWTVMHFDMLNRLSEPLRWAIITFGLVMTAIQMARGIWQLRVDKKRKSVEKPE